MATYNGSSGNDSITGSSFADSINGGGGDDTLYGGNGDDLIVGGAGTDTARFRGAFGDYTITWDPVARQFRVQHRVPNQDGVDLVSGVEFFRFADGTRTFSSIDPTAHVGDLVVGTSSSEQLVGGMGHDTLQGAAGNDRLDAREGDDILSGGEGSDTLSGWSGNDRLEGGNGVDTAQFRASYGSYVISWDAATRLYTVRDLINGRDGTDLVTGVERFQFADGLRTIADLVEGAGDGAVLAGTIGNDLLVGGEGYDSLSGGAGNDRLDGQAAHDTLQGGDGSDTLIGGTGNDSLDGGAGFDVARFTGAFADYDITWDGMAGQFKLVHRSGADGIDVVAGVEAFQFADGTKDATLLVPERGFDLMGGFGDDFLSGGMYGDRLRGLDGRDVLEGREADDTLEGGAGDDQLAGGAGNDQLAGGDGMDTARFNGASWEYDISWNAATRQYTIAHRWGPEGTDVVGGVELFAFADGMRDWSNLVAGAGDGLVASGTAGDDYLIGSMGYDLLQGLDGKDVLDGQAANDTLDGGSGDDRLMGGAGNDSLTGGAGMDVAQYMGYSWEYDISWDAGARQYTIAHRYGQEGTDVVGGVELFAFADGMRDWSNLVPGAGDGVVVAGTWGDDYVYGGMGYDRLFGLDGNDVLDGQGANDTLDGGLGDDRLMGGAGDDDLTGGTGMDVAQFMGYSWEYDISWDATARQYTIAHRYGPEGIDVVRGVELFAFADGMRDWSTLVPGAGDGVFASGTAGDDYLYGSMGYDQLRGLEGNDVLDGQAANDTLDGGAGDDRLMGGAGNDNLTGGTGMDVAQFMGYSWEYDISWDATARQYTIAHRYGPEGIDVVRGVELFAFADGMRDWSNLVPGAGDGVVASGTAGDDYLYGSMGYDQLQGLEGNDVLDGQAASDTLDGGAGDDRLMGGAGNDNLTGGTGMDVAQFMGYSWEYDISWDAATRQYTIAHRYGPEGVDVVSGVELFAFADGMRDWGNLVPGAGDGVVASGTAGDDYLYGSMGYDQLQGLEGNDVLDGQAASDTLDGGAGDDRLMGGAGNDNLTGGTGMDVAQFMGYSWEYDISWDAATRQYTISHRYGQDGVDVASGIELFQFADGLRDWSNLVPGAGDGLVLQGTGANEMFASSAGYDYVDGAGGDDILGGQASADTLVGGDGEDVLNGGSGNDSLVGGAGVDTAQFSGSSWEYDFSWDAACRTYTVSHRYGGDGADVLSGVEYASFANGLLATSSLVYGVGQELTGTADGDWLTGAEGGDAISGLAGLDSLEGMAGNDTLLGGDDDDRLDGGAGNDELRGGAGADTAVYRGTRADYDVSWDSVGRQYTITDRVTGRDGTDVVSGVETFQFSQGSARHWGNLLPDAGDGLVLDNGANGGFLQGGTGYDLLRGGEGYDWLEGGGANDTLSGGANEDNLAGGSGRDTFVFDTARDHTVDRISDFQGGQDRIELDADFFEGLVAGALPAAAFQAGNGSEAAGADVRIVYDTATGTLYYDGDGSGWGSPVAFAVLTNYGMPASLGASDLVVS